MRQIYLPCRIRARKIPIRSFDFGMINQQALHSLVCSTERDCIRGWLSRIRNLFSPRKAGTPLPKDCGSRTDFDVFPRGASCRKWVSRTNLRTLEPSSLRLLKHSGDFLPTTRGVAFFRFSTSQRSPLLLLATPLLAASSMKQPNRLRRCSGEV